VPLISVLGIFLIDKRGFKDYNFVYGAGKHVIPFWGVFTNYHLKWWFCY